MSARLLSPLAARLAEAWSPADWREVTVVLAVSGGADSVAMLRAMRELKDGGAGRLMAAHFNHRLRGEESDRDEQFVRSLCEGWAIPCIVRQAKEALHGKGDGLEAAARAARYDFLRDVATEHGARYVATAHTADDQAETILHRILRGTGVAGLSGIPRTRPLAPGVTLIRPLLAFRHEELRDYLRREGQVWREDDTNRLLHFTRNRLRRDLLPRLRAEYNADVDDALVRLGRLAAEAQAVIDDAAAALLDSAVLAATADEVVIDPAPLASLRPYLICEFFIALWRRQNWPRGRMTHDDWRRLANLAMSPGDPLSLTLPGAIAARRLETQILLTRDSPSSAATPEGPGA